MVYDFRDFVFDGNLNISWKIRDGIVMINFNGIFYVNVFRMLISNWLINFKMYLKLIFGLKIVVLKKYYIGFRY